jgi:hypothetical protein
MWSKGRSRAETQPVVTAWPGRPLVATERAFFTISQGSALNLVVLIRLTGPDLDDLLPQALAAIQQRHPLLRAVIAGGRSRPRFDVRPSGAAGEPGPIPRRLIAGADRTAEVVDEEMNAPFDTGVGPLARAALITGPGLEHDLVLTLHHSIADGASAACLVHDLLGWCESVAAGTAGAAPAPLPIAPSPQPLTAILPAHMRRLRVRRATVAYLARQARDEVGYQRGSRGLRRPVPPPGRARSRLVGLDRDGTTSLVDRARRSRLTLTSLLSAALLWQASAVLYGDRPAAMRVMIWVDLRRHLDPAVPDEVLGCYASMLRFVIRVDPREEFATLVARVQDEIARAARRGDRIPAALLSPVLTRMLTRWPVARLGTVAVSYATAPAVRASYGPIAVREIRAFVTNLRLGADLAAVCGVFGGALWCDLLYLDSDIGEAQADAVTAGLLSTLGQFIGVASGSSATPSGEDTS